ncbi:maleylpyruvate isomerase family mycothiol-dependent enzyme [Streptomyces sp. A7024]|uniref:Maleylpyruvate isomerase family mycothiol-dependent enzyme n=1 Tax=Streptomyces coryli TaxID=1128680 RepID=A0A6G4U8Z9_9ACTN|nr:maleylpyruvate isomerase family mycothiol-dependent enzyme [Streptomyces coryli]NGN68715.1 maleylpyruvate isomerase family mycothiol-dependent enzyme [Streptomyces coryli]
MSEAAARETAEHDVETLRAATDRLLEAAARLDDPDLAAPSRLPGWTRGHVLAHLARNADALVNVLKGRPMYPSPEARDADIEAGAPRPLDEQLTDVRTTATLLEETAAAVPDWSARCELRNGVTDVKSRIPFRRLIEVELHHVDLGIGYELGDLPADFVRRETDFLAARFSGNAVVPPIHLTAADGSTWRTGGEEGEPVSVTGEPAALMGWLAGRTKGEGVDAGGARLPVLPPL